MNNSDGNFMDVTSFWIPPPSPSPRTILSMLNQTDNDQNLMTQTFSQSNMPRDQPRQRSGGLGERLAARIKFQLPTLDNENISPFSDFSWDSPIVPYMNVSISPGFSQSAVSQHRSILSDSSQVIPSPFTNNEPLEIVEGLGEGHTSKMVFTYGLPDHQVILDHQMVHVNMPPHEVIEEVNSNIFSMQTENENNEENNRDENYVTVDADKNEDKDEDHNIVDVNEDEDKDRDHNIFDKLKVSESLKNPKRRKYEQISNMIGATRTTKQQRVIIQMESEEENPDDGFHWRKYGQKVVKGNFNPRSYYKCTYDRCKMKKHVERGAEDAKLLVTTYDGIHKHHAPVKRDSNSRNRNGSSKNNINHRLGSPLLTSFPRMDTRPPFISSGPQTNMTKLFMSGLSKLPSLPVNHNPGFEHKNVQMVNRNSVFIDWNFQPGNQMPSCMFQNDGLINQNLGFMWRNDQPSIDDVPNGVDVYMRIIQRLSKYGVKF